VKEVREDRGNVTVLGLAISIVVLAIGFIGIVQVEATLASHRVQSAADLSALAGAQSLGDPCDAAIAIAKANSVELVACDSESEDISVVVEANAPSLIAALFRRFDLPIGRVSATAKAGPAGL
jgi:secretion/DNA translocation related TadE-like protein